MSPSSTGEGTKIAQAAKDLNVTSVTIRRYLSEFNIETTTDENGVKVLPDQAMEELKTIRKLKEDGITNPKVMEALEEGRSSSPIPKKPKAKTRIVSRITSKSSAKAAEEEQEIAPEEEIAASQEDSAPEEEQAEVSITSESDAPGESDSPARAKHSLTCQTCGKVFEHMNPRLRDCLDCYRTKRKERRRGGSGDRHKNVIQHPLALQAQAASKNTQQQVQQAPVAQFVPTQKVSTVRNYRKAIEDTRHITGNLKRRLERPDLTDGERRWLEQIYAYQLILHQGWRHLSEYKNADKQQPKSEQSENPII